ncbi:MAG: ABC transporter ATP-binding protein, partial [Alphaproteobacteria bacterium]
MNGNTLELRGLTKRFGGVTAIDDLDLRVEPGQVTALIGPNGAGKTTAINLISGFLTPNQGDILFDGTRINDLPMHRRATAGIARTYQTPQITPGLSVLENVMLGAHKDGRFRLLDGLMRPSLLMQEQMRLRHSAEAALELVVVDPKFYLRQGADMAYGIQRAIELARLFVHQAGFLLLDEPAAGLNHYETDEVAAFVRARADEGRAVLLVEHDMDMVMKVSDRIAVLNFGRLIAQGSPDDIRTNPHV